MKSGKYTYINIINKKHIHRQPIGLKLVKRKKKEKKERGKRKKRSGERKKPIGKKEKSRMSLIPTS